MRKIAVFLLALTMTGFSAVDSIALPKLSSVSDEIMTESELEERIEVMWEGLMPDEDFHGYLVTLRMAPPGELRSFSSGTSSAVTAEAVAEMEELEPVLPEEGLYFTKDLSVIQENLEAVWIREIQPNFLYRALSAVPNDTYFSGQTYFDIIRANGLWDPGGNAPSMNGRKPKIAVLDTGIDGNHEEFAGYWAQNTQGHFLATELQKNANNQWEASSMEGEPVDNATTFHGTGVCSLIGAASNNGKGIASLAANGELYVAAVLGSDGIGSTLQVVKAMEWVLDKKVDVINMSLGGPNYDKVFDTKVQEAIRQGVIVVAAVGNEAERLDRFTSATHYKKGNPTIQVTVENYNSYPAGFDNVIGVGALTPDGKTRASFSHYNETVDVTAPGQFIRTAVGNNGYSTFSGTSFAAPIVSSAAALVKSRNSKVNAPAFLQLIRDTGQDLGEPGYDYEYGYGLLNVEKLMAYGAPVIADSISLNSANLPFEAALTEQSDNDESSTPWGTDNSITLKITKKAVPQPDETPAQSCTAIIGEYENNTLVGTAAAAVDFSQTNAGLLTYRAKAAGNKLKIYILGEGFALNGTEKTSLTVPAAEGGNS